MSVTKSILLQALQEYDPNYAYELKWKRIEKGDNKYELQITAVPSHRGEDKIVHKYEGKSQSSLKSDAIAKWKEESDVKAKKEETRKPKKGDSHKRHGEVIESQTADGEAVKEERDKHGGGPRKRRFEEDEKEVKPKHKKVKEGDKSGRGSEKPPVADADNKVDDPDAHANGEEAGKRRRERHYDKQVREESDAFIDDADPRTPRYKDFISA
ncbi:uncharacterized protein FOMMEDRAFT_150434 [Fomitiporia mediterranea MF3/22]|uniref:uncharacterized protein n=1 Tax=Fomitiporia mediterranea (strain MF3/22) TaxID=694068 RepID=UPI0004408CE3|nr:uncharacterized protein FOMMEDRAFT_150434 [Fomitiporia mediterranea MF3/22]EJD07851.1 hypothetical protein FOMMEDRAFT_150434 [Fomitiporia mediterranea MF3/22]